ncbi:MAG: oxygenase MpaB family protein, partial [Dehalococcoidia bacterium]|nr:oxygenase MpaB family protein [Dehalococcoidia bacterium]
VMDDLLEEIAPLPRHDISTFIKAGMDQDNETLKKAPQAMRDFFDESLNPPPDWVDYDAFLPGIRSFQRNSPTILAAFVAGTLINGFTTLISKSFVQTGRIFDNGVWRLRQNNRHMIEIFWPGGLTRQGDGWKLSVRIRFAHGQIRRLLAQTSEWDHEALGVPVSAAHMGFAVANFSSQTLLHAQRLGARFTAEERVGYLAVWRYSGYLMGVPETLLYRDEGEAQRMYDLGRICEPPPTTDSILMTNALINSAPLVAGIEDKKERESLVHNVIYPVSRALVGKATADQLRFPRGKQLGTLFFFRLGQRIDHLKGRLLRKPPTNFASLIGASAYSEYGIAYNLPDHPHAERSSPW